MGNLQNLIYYCEDHNINLFEDCTVPTPLEMDQVVNNIILRCGLLTPVYSEPETFKMMTKMWFQSNQWNFEHLVKIMLANYSPIENVYESEQWKEQNSGTDKLTHGETHTLSGTDTLTHGEKHTLSGTDTLTHGEKHTLSGTDTLTHGETHTLSGKDTVKDTTTNEHQVSAYNEDTYQSDSKDIRNNGPETTYGKKDTASGDDKTQYGKTDTASGDDKTQYGKTDTASGDDKTQYGKTDTASGTDRTEHGHIIEYTKLRHGNIGVTTNNQLINQELEMLENFNIYDWIAAKFERDNMIQLY